ncbi:MAG: metallophosphoesterase [Clostridia bacterium]|nr:metallophosphoesterase [Clostridia bacterium]
MDTTAKGGGTMKMLVFSDSHGRADRIVEAIDLHKNNTDVVIFLGDGLSDIEYLRQGYPQIAFYMVKGNCDFFTGSVHSEQVITLDGIRIFITHGHLYGAKSRYESMTYRAAELGCDAAFFGHTHLAEDNIYDVYDKRIHLFNPGSIGYEGSYGIVNTSKGVLVTSHAKII